MLQVPPSVLAYFTQFDVQTAVDLMGGSKDPKVPPTLRWDDVGNFYRARLAALQVPVEFAIFLEELWRAVWADVPARWKAAQPSKPSRPDLSISVGTVWDEGCFSRSYTCGNHALELSVSLNAEEGLQFGILLFDDRDDDESILDADQLVGWSQPENVLTYWTEHAVNPLKETFATEPFREYTQQAWAAIDAAMVSN
jgi:hypothetical protein